MKIMNLQKIRAPWSEDHWEDKRRQPVSYWKKEKEFEDFLMKTKIPNLTVYTICAGIPYGYAETVFNSHIRVNFPFKCIHFYYRWPGYKTLFHFLISRTEKILFQLST